VAEKSASSTRISGLAKRYAGALFDLARDAKSVDAVAADLARFESLITDNHDVAQLVRSPIFSAEQQERAVAAVLAKAGISGLAANFIRLVAANRRLFALPDMILGFRQLVAKAKGIVPIEVQLAQLPSPAMLETIKTALKQVAKNDVDVDVVIDPSLIGGLIVKMGSRMVDASLKTKLQSIHIAMKEAG
jgi:F-type H+-transporting ATPase subunit delta